MRMNKNIHTFIGCDSEFEDANLVLFGAPFDSTTSYRPGARFACSAIRGESPSIETYSPYQDKDLCDFAIFDAGDLELPFGNPQRALDAIKDFTDKIISTGKKPLMIGGEHLVSLGAVQSALGHYPNLHILHFDAHADLREDYLGEKLSHATVMRRIWDLVGDGRIFQFGIRSGDRSEFLWSKTHVVTNKYGFDNINEAMEMIGDAPVYLSIDLDVLDPSVFPGTGTPEAGGVTFPALLAACTLVSSLHIVGADVNELSPIYDTSGASTSLACKFIRELMLLLCK